MPWILAQDTAVEDLSPLLPLLPFLKYGLYGFVLVILYFSGIASKHLYEMWRNYKTDSNKDANDKIEQDLKRGKAKLELNVKEEEQVEAQLQRVINQQDRLITKVQAEKDALQTAYNEMYGKLARAETTEKFLTQQLEQEKKYSGQITEQYNQVRRKYYTLKNGIKPDSDVVPPGTEMLPDNLQ